MLTVERNMAMKETFETCYGKMGEVESPQIIPIHKRDGHSDVPRDQQKPLPFSFYHTFLKTEAKCTFCLSQIEVGDGDVAVFGTGNTKPFHISCLKMCLPHIGILTFNSQKCMFIKIENDMKEGEEVTYMTQRIVMDGSHRMRVLECLINKVPIDDACFDRPKRKRGRHTSSTQKVKREKKEEEVIRI